ncbi:MAG TPA: NAD-dependent epimerase/dehydratase family protein, partial [Micromonosporaceae bacterium]|nr:NAD-dependent epimerase/dehydratase family protein [Micromonosporaceae bacterium]
RRPRYGGRVRVLVLGGTSFVGRAVVADALRAGLDLTLFHRGRTGAGLFPGVPRRTGDRDTGDYATLAGGAWDAVVDVSGYVPRHVGQAMDALGDRVGRYLFISSHAVYAREGVGPGSDESAPRRPPVRRTEDLDDATYGPLKVACEDDVLARYGDRATIVRPGKVAGPHDPQDTFTYWVRRAARGGSPGTAPGVSRRWAAGSPRPTRSGCSPRCQPREKGCTAAAAPPRMGYDLVHHRRRRRVPGHRRSVPGLPPGGAHPPADRGGDRTDPGQ